MILFYFFGFSFGIILGLCMMINGLKRLFKTNKTMEPASIICAGFLVSFISFGFLYNSLKDEFEEQPKIEEQKQQHKLNVCNPVSKTNIDNFNYLICDSGQLLKVNIYIYDNYHIPFVESNSKESISNNIEKSTNSNDLNQFLMILGSIILLTIGGILLYINL